MLNLIRAFLRERFDAVVTTGIPTIESIPSFLIAKVTGIPVIIKESHWYWPNTFSSKFSWSINKLMNSNSTLVVCPGKRAYSYWRSIGIPENKIRIVPFYASELEWNMSTEKEAAKLRELYSGKTIILYFGRLLKKKGVDYLLEAFARINREYTDVILIISGDGPERQCLEHTCNQLHLSNVIFTGAPEEKIKAVFFQSCDLYVYPSITMEIPEEWPLGVVEAMSVGKPVIITNAVGSAPDVVQHGVNGFVVPEKDSKALYTAMKRIITDKELRKSMGVASAKIIKNGFTYDYAAEGLTEIIDYVIQPKTQQNPTALQQPPETSLRNTA